MAVIKQNVYLVYINVILNFKTDKGLRDEAKKVADELAQISKDIKNKKNLSPAFSSTKEAVKWLEA